MRETSLTVDARHVRTLDSGLSDRTLIASLPEPRSRLGALIRIRLKVSMAYAAMMIALHFGFVLLVAYNKPLLATRIAPGFTLAVLSGALVVIGAVALTAGYTVWARRYEDKTRELAEHAGLSAND